MTSCVQKNVRTDNQTDVITDKRKKQNCRQSFSCFNRKQIVFALCFWYLLTIPVFPNISSPFYTQPSHMRIVKRITTAPVLKKCWENTFITKNISIASDNPKEVFLLSEDNKIHSINSSDGNVNWVFEIGGTKISDIFVSGQSLYVGGSAETVQNKPGGSADNNAGKEKGNNQKSGLASQIYLRSVGAVTGIPEWSAVADVRDKIANDSTDESDGKIYLGRNENDVFLLHSSGNLFFAKKNNKGLMEWSRKYDTGVREFFDLGLNGNTNSNLLQKIFAFYGADKKFYLAKSKTGEIFGSFDRSFTVTSAVLLSPSNIIIGDEKGNISSINFQNVKAFSAIWSVKTGGGVSSISLTAQGILVTSLDNFVYLIDPYKGNRLWKKRLSGRLLYKPSVIEKENTFIVVENDSAYFINLENGAVVNQINLADGDYFINTPVAFEHLYIFPTNSGIVAYSDSQCP